jgi:predicted transposase YdaD
MQFDATLKDLLEAGPADWLSWLRGMSGRQVRLIDADVSTVTAAADKVLWVDDSEPWIFHLEVQASREAEPGRRLHLYNTLLGHRHRVPVETSVVLLRREANSPLWSGTWEQFRRDGRRYLAFQYEVVRLWEQPLEPLLTGGLATLPLAPLTDDAAGKLPETMARLHDRLQGAPKEQAEEIRAATFILMGLRYEETLIEQLFQGLPQMEESVTYQAILRKGREKGLMEGRVEGLMEGRVEGRVEEARGLLLRHGRKFLGDPGPEIESAIQQLTSLDRLETLMDRLHDVASWQELLASK